MDLTSTLPSTQVTADPSRSFSLPGWAYTDPDVLELEKREIFFKTWQYAGWVGDLKEAGDYITAELIDQSVIIVRGQDGALQGFHNVCQHRGHQLLTGCGKVAAITCPYHAWVYRLDGALRNARGAEFDRLFLTGMIQHHGGALIMVKELFDSPGSGQDADLFDFVTDVDSGQRAEIRIMENMLKEKQ